MKKFIKKVLNIWRSEGLLSLLRKIARKLLLVIRTGKWQSQPEVRSYQLDIFPQTEPTNLVITSQFYPDLSVLVYVRGDCIFGCLAALQENLVGKYAAEVIVLVMGDPPLPQLLTTIGIQILYTPDQLTEVAAWNYLAQKAIGKYLLFLDDRCLIGSHFLMTLLPIVSQGKAVGPKIVSEYRQLLSAGTILNKEGKLAHFGDQDFPGEPEYNYVRPATSLSPLGLAIAASIFRQLHGFCQDFTSGEYAMADFCHRLRAQDIPVFYQPQAVLVYRGVSLPTGNLPDRALWQKTCGQNWQPAVLPDRQFSSKPTILVIDTLVPPYDKESGAFRLFQILQIFCRQGFSVIFLPEYGHEQEPYTAELEALGIEVLYFTYQQNDWRLRLEKRLTVIDIAWVCRPELCEKYFPILQQNPQIKLIYDTIDLHFLRLKREQELAPHKKPTDPWQVMQQREIDCAQKADATLVVTPIEQNILQELAIENVWVVPNIHPIFKGVRPGHADRQGLLFIGGYYHIPNVDAVLWLCQEIMPLLWKVLPDLRLTLLGSYPPPEVQALATDRVIVPGYVPEVSSYFLSHRIFIAPLRYGAGMKGKIGHSLSFGLPVVTTTIGAEGIGLEPEKNVLIADQPSTFAMAVHRLYKDPDLWAQLSQGAHQLIAQYSPEAVEPIILQVLSQLLP